MKKVGFIDYYLDEWHANQYPKMIHEISEGRMEVAYAYGEIDAPSGRTNAQWAKEMNRHFSKEDIELTNEYMKRGSTLLMISSVQSLSHVRLFATP